MITLIVAFLTASGIVTETHQYATAEACTSVAQMLDGQTNPQGEPMRAACIQELK